MADAFFREVSHDIHRMPTLSAVPESPEAAVIEAVLAGTGISFLGLVLAVRARWVDRQGPAHEDAYRLLTGAQKIAYRARESFPLSAEGFAELGVPDARMETEMLVKRVSGELSGALRRVESALAALLAHPVPSGPGDPQYLRAQSQGKAVDELEGAVDRAFRVLERARG